MGKTTHNEDEARHLVKQWMTKNNVNAAQLAKRAGRDRSTISRFINGSSPLKDTLESIFDVLRQTEEVAEQQRFLRAAGLPLSWASAARSPLYNEPERPEHRGIRLWTEANELAKYSWVQAIELYRMAEESLGNRSNLSAQIAISIALKYIDLGDYTQAGKEIVRVERIYGSLLDPATRVEFVHANGWFHLVLGDLIEAERLLNSAIEIAQTYDIDPIASHYFLGRVHHDYVLRLQNNGSDFSKYLHKAEEYYDQSHGVHQKHREEWVVYNVFSKAQLLRNVPSRYDEYSNLLTRAKEMFDSSGNHFDGIAVDVEEARMQLAHGQTRYARRIAEEQLEGSGIMVTGIRLEMGGYHDSATLPQMWEHHYR